MVKGKPQQIPKTTVVASDLMFMQKSHYTVINLTKSPSLIQFTDNNVTFIFNLYPMNPVLNIQNFKKPITSSPFSFKMNTTQNREKFFYELE